MLESIHIENIALIKKLDVSFSGGFSAFTGETGAGKSIIVDSIGVICGERFSKELIRSGEASATVEGVFSGLSEESVRRLGELGLEPDEDGFLVVSRTISADGKSQSRINYRHVPTSLLREISAFLINIHGQHDNQNLLKKEKHLDILDSFAECEPLLAKYSEIYDAYRGKKREYDGILTDDAEKERTIEMLKFQIEEISSLNLKADEEEMLTAEKKKLSNIEKISENALLAYGALFENNLSATENIDKALSCLNALSKITDGCDEYIDRLEKARSEVYDVAEYIRDMASDADEDPSAKLDRIEQRLFDIYKLKRKYGPTLEDVLSYLEKAKERLSSLEFSDIRLKELEKELKVLDSELEKAAAELTDARTKGAERLRAEIEKELRFLEMSKVKFLADIKEKEYAPDGRDDVEFMVKTNEGMPFSPLAKTASGGELSRIMLAIKSVIAKKDGVETLIFDEVDTGISGKTSRSIGIKLLTTSRYSQVMCVTHSAQIASLADDHFLVSKKTDGGETVTLVRKLGDEERVDETARIISGINITEASRKTAKELIEDAKNY